MSTLYRLMGALPPTGDVAAAVEASEEELRLLPGVVAAEANGPRSVVVSGRRTACPTRDWRTLRMAADVA